MRDLQEKKRFRDLLYSPVLSAVLLMIIISLVRSNYSIYKKNQVASINRQESDKRLSLLREKSDNLTASLLGLETDRGVEEELRNKFQIMKNGEEVLVVVDEEIEPKDMSADDKDGDYWQKFKNFFGL